MTIVRDKYDGAKFINMAYALLDSYMTVRGFSFTFEDCDVPVEVPKGVTDLDSIRTQMGEQAVAYMRTQRCNNLLDMTESGSKGSRMNIQQMCCRLGQQLGPKSEVFEKNTCHYRASKAPGDIRSSFLDGMSAPELFDHARAGRDGLINTAVKTSKTGYAHNKVTKALEELISHADGTVRYSTGQVIQMVAGDGFSPDMVQTYPLERHEDTEILKALWKQMDAIQLPFYHKWNQKIASPVPFEMLQKRYTTTFDDDDSNIFLADALWKRLRIHKSLKTSVHFWTHMRPSVLASVSIPDYFNAIENYYMRAVLPSGTAVGIRAAQDMGEPLTQTTLDQFHRAGMRYEDSISRWKQITEAIGRSNNTMYIYRDDDMPLDEFALSLLGIRISDVAIDHFTSNGSVRFILDKEKCIRLLVCPSIIANSIPHAVSWSNV